MNKIFNHFFYFHILIVDFLNVSWGNIYLKKKETIDCTLNYLNYLLTLNYSGNPYERPNIQADIKKKKK